MSGTLSPLFESKNKSGNNRNDVIGISVKNKLNPSQGVATTIHGDDDDDHQSLIFICKALCVRTTANPENVIRVNSTISTATMKTQQGSILQRFIAALFDAPVRDSDMAVYDCYNMPDSTALPWALSLNFNFVSPTKLRISTML
ncbi:hypothetical protein PoB_007017500 [Plakobranchus ocellatus]|uniref:Uncharacterized protein n=1 Tax=Plakobranchus ocellatus TaxID=259542 RepID=A0AAV4DI70_9GAST|nr:hypothetical protein PoB_007017500 [Plakobranchus ocellatus]